MIQRIIILILLVNCAVCINLTAQESYNTAGGNIENSAGSVSFTIGQTFNSTFKNSNISVSCGVQQPYEIFVINSINENNNITLDCSISPNPTTDYFVLDIKNYDPNLDWTYILLNVNGTILQHKEINSNVTQINLSNLNSSVYFLKVANSSVEMKTFKIIKN